ncbi:MAG: hypothetical protein MPN21_06290 [Thermoanaerobaculia bacterium]|nr:hypothetical protein [Thermoanaerobaculia bacterium]
MRSLFEFEDQPWLPSSLRDYMTDALRGLFSSLCRRTRVADRLACVLKRCNENSIVDLCSGGTGALCPVIEDLELQGLRPSVLLTDRYPNIPAFESLCRASDGRFEFRSEPIDATAIPPDLDGVRTLFAAFHHFEDEDAVTILRDAASKRCGLAVFEASERHPVMILAMPLVTLAVLVITPSLRPFRLGRIVFTYLLPIVPLLVFWDGAVSCLRTRTVAELR